MDSLYESLAAIQRRLSQAGIPSVAIGALAVGVWGRGRTTNDVDLKLLLHRQEAPRLLEALGQDYPCLTGDPLETLKAVGFMFVRDQAGTRIDLLLADMGFDERAIRRARTVEVRPGLSAAFCTPEDLVIYKLISTRPKDHEDARNVILRQGKSLDCGYIVDWLRQFEEALDDSTLVDAFETMARPIR